jgi:protein-L-isoaspartate(D-aspartate) O-methyltransferase
MRASTTEPRRIAIGTTRAAIRIMAEDTNAEREAMVRRQLVRRGIQDPRVIEAFRQVPRERFIPASLAEFAYDDSPLPIAESQTISQPYIVAAMTEALALRGDERVLEVGTGSGYAAAILARVAREVVTIERHASLADTARARLAELGFANVVVLTGDGTLGAPAHAPFDAIIVAAGGPTVPETLLAQLAPGGRLVMPVGPTLEEQRLVRITHQGDQFSEEELGAVRFVPLVGAEGWPEPATASVRRPDGSTHEAGVRALVRETAQPIGGIESVPLDALLDRIGDARVVMLGEATHGTSEFYRMRARITRELIEKRGFSFVAVEADWPDAQRVDEHVTLRAHSGPAFTPFSRFPTWMWRNEETRALVDWMRAHNEKKRDPLARVGFHGLDLYSMFTSIAAVIDYLDRVDPDTAHVARARYGTLTPFQKDPAAYGRAVLTGRYRSSEEAVVAMLKDMLQQRIEYARRDGDRFFDAAQNARLVADAERYYRTMYYGSAASWNLRDTHMFETLESLLAFHGPSSRGIVWAHNSHLGDARATEMSARGEHNIGQLVRERHGERAYGIGFGTDHGTVAAAADWDAPMQVMSVRPGRSGSYEKLFHECELPAFLLPLRNPRRAELRNELSGPRLERAIGVVYRPQTERQSHYFDAVLPSQFDEYVWFDETRAVAPLAAPARPMHDVLETYPFGL